MIYEIQNPILLPQILEHAKRLDTPLDALENMLIQAISFGDTNSKILVDEKDGTLRGFCFGSIEFFDGENVVFVQACSIDPWSVDETNEEKSTFDEFLSRMLHWAQERKLGWVYIATKRHKAFKRRAKFEYHNTLMRRKVQSTQEAKHHVGTFYKDDEDGSNSDHQQVP